jgi:RNA recognition motif-containing protein
MQGVVLTPNAPDLAQPAPVAAGTAPEPAPLDENACETLYIQNLNEKIKPDSTFYTLARSVGRDIDWKIGLGLLLAFLVMKASLRGLFKVYGEVLDVVAHSNLRMRGQAFVSFESPEIAKKAMAEVQRFPLYSKPMVRESALVHPYSLLIRASCVVFSKSRSRERHRTLWYKRRILTISRRTSSGDRNIKVRPSSPFSDSSRSWVS